MGEPPLDAAQAWDAGAQAFIHFVDSGADYYRHLVHGPGLLAACGDVRGLRALDLGCGHGYFTRALARAGATVVGLDLSAALLTHAQTVEAGEPLGITYVHADAARAGDLFPPAAFDLVTGCMSVQDVADTPAVLAGAARLIPPAGRVVFSIPHPCTDPPVRRWLRDDAGRKLLLGLDRYFDSGPAVCDWSMPRLLYPWKTPFRRHTLTEWSGFLRGAGLVILGLFEPQPDAALIAVRPESLSRPRFWLAGRPACPMLLVRHHPPTPAPCVGPWKNTASSSRISPSVTAPSPRWTTCPSRCARGRCSACSGPTGRARPPRSRS